MISKLYSSNNKTSPRTTAHIHNRWAPKI